MLSLTNQLHVRPVTFTTAVVLACVAGNVHDIGIRAISDFFEMAGWRAISLGPDVPHDEIARSAGFFDADVVVLAATLDPHLKAVDFWQEVDHPTEGSIRMTRFPVTFSETPAENRQHAPRLGEHSLEILEEAGLDQSEIEVMIASRATVVAE